MKKAIIILICFGLFTSCHKKQRPLITMPVEKYKLLAKPSEDLIELKKLWDKSKVAFEMDFSTGEFKGVYKKKSYSGKYDIQKVSSGFVKGFNYKVELAYLGTDESEDVQFDKFINKLARCRRIFVKPDRLIDSQYVTAELRTDDESEKLLFLLLR